MTTSAGESSTRRTEIAIATILSIGIVAVMLAALTYKVFELDRYFVPKELVMNAAAAILAAIMIAKPEPLKLDVLDGLLIAFLAWSFISAIFATNHWLAQRAFALSLSSAIVFWSARRVTSPNVQRAMLNVAAFAGIVVAATSLAQAYGAESDFFTLARAPGGTLGNRNFIAHIVAIALPITVWCAVTARRGITALAWSLGLGLLAATLVLSRSRAAWLAVAATVMVTAIPLLVSRKYWKGTNVGGRLARMLLVAVIAGTIAVIIPNDLEWKSDSPYLESARNVVDYSSGSGKGRIAQYRNSLKIVTADPIFGAGPGNWAVRYPKFAPRGDKSLADNGMTANPWPSSDWVAFVSERGAIAALPLLVFFAGLFLVALRKWRELADYETILKRLALAGTVVSTMVVSAFDAVLLLPAPAFLVWLIAGASIGERKTFRVPEVPLARRRIVTVAVATLAIIGALRSASQTIAMSKVGTGGRTAGWISGARFDPGSYRINQRLADLYANRRQCTRAKPYARQALDLFPDSPAAKRVARRCGIRG